MGPLKLNYELTKEEIEETLLCLEWKREGRFKSVNLGIISVLGVIVLAAYIRSPENIFLFFLLLMIILMLFYLWYGPQRRRRKIAEAMVGKGGRYQIIIGDSYIGTADNGRRIHLQGKKLKCYVSERMYILKVDRENFAIPRRILGREQEEKLKRLTGKYQADIVNVVIRKE